MFSKSLTILLAAIVAVDAIPNFAPGFQGRMGVQSGVSIHGGMGIQALHSAVGVPLFNGVLNNGPGHPLSGGTFVGPGSLGPQPTTLGLLSLQQVQRDIVLIYDSISSVNSSPNTLLRIITTRTPQQMEQIRRAYDIAYKTLTVAISIDTWFSFKNTMLSCVWSRWEFEAQWLHRAMKWLGEDNSVISEILVGRTNFELVAIQEAYRKLFKKSLISGIRHVTILNLQRFYEVLLTGRDENAIANVDADVRSLFKAGRGRIGINIKTFINILCKRSTTHLRMVFARYQVVHRESLSNVIRKKINLQRGVRRALIHLYEFILDPITKISAEFNDSVKNIGTRDKKLVRLVARHFRFEVFGGPDRHNLIKDRFKQMYGKELIDRIGEDTNTSVERAYQSSLQLMIKFADTKEMLL